MKRTFFLLFGIVLIAIALRFWQLGAVPASPDWDEASIGFNAKSIAQTGRDEYGSFMPLTIRSFGDYKPPMYVYLAVPPVSLFGLTAWSIRLPSAIMGVLAVVGVFFLVTELFEERNKYALALVSSLLLAISPWHIQFSRVAFEANIGLTFTIWAVTAFLAGLRNRVYMPVAASLFGLGLYTYHSERIFLPLLVIYLGYVYRKQLFRKEYRKYLLSAFVIAVIVVAPLIPVLLNKASISRLSGTSAINQQTILLARTVKKLEEDRRASDFVGLVLDNRRLIWIKTIVSGYLSHFSLKWLFITGDHARHHAPDMGLLYIWELPFLFLGLYIICKKIKGYPRAILIGWFLLAPVAASPTTDLPHAVRTLVFLPVFQIITAAGILGTAAYLSAKHTFWRKAACIYAAAAVFVIAIFNFAYYLDMYFVQMNPEFSQAWQYGYKDLVNYTEAHKANYKKVVISTQLDQSYIFFLFYMNYDPIKYLAGGGTMPQGPDPIKQRFDKYEFRDLNLALEPCDGSELYVVSPREMTRGNVMEITYLDGQPAIELLDTKCKNL